MTKNIVFCADGTWNDPGQDENGDRVCDPTNVYKLFEKLAGCLSHGYSQDEQEKVLEADGNRTQIAKYLHGVGDSHNPIVKVLGGAFGAGVVSRIVRGYTFLSRNYEPGDKIFIVGFSRGAYTARALTGLVVSQGLLAPKLCQGDKEQVYRYGAEAWHRYRSETAHESQLAHLLEVLTELPAFLAKHVLEAKDFVSVDQIAAVGVWDTVGALGFPEFSGKGQRVDAFQFADNCLSPKVGRGLQALALDERREDFTPTFWDTAPNVSQMIFPGAHADVGGGYPASGNESGLSDICLQWMMEGLISLGLHVQSDNPPVLKADPLGVAHKPWIHGVWREARQGSRHFPAGMPHSPAVEARMAAPAVVSEPGEPPKPYRPKNLP